MSMKNQQISVRIWIQFESGTKLNYLRNCSSVNGSLFRFKRGFVQHWHGSSVYCYVLREQIFCALIWVARMLKSRDCHVMQEALIKLLLWRVCPWNRWCLTENVGSEIVKHKSFSSLKYKTLTCVSFNEIFGLKSVNKNDCPHLSLTGYILFVLN